MTPVVQALMRLAPLSYKEMTAGDPGGRTCPPMPAFKK